MVSSRTAAIKFRIAIMKAGLKHKDIAAKLKVTPPHFCNMLNGKDAFIKKHREKLNKLLNTNY